MDRNTALAIGLSVAIIMVWSIFFAPEPEPPSPAPQETVQPAPETPSSEPDLIESPIQQTAPAFVPDSTMQAATAGEEALITVETDLYTAVFSSKGATIKSFKLKEYQTFDKENLVEMVQAEEVGALSLAFTTPTSRLFDSRAVYFTADQPDGATLRAEDAPVTLSFEVALGEGTIRQTYTFTPDSYEIGLTVAQENPAAFSTAEGYELVWSGGIPFAEQDPEQEAMNSGAFARSGGEVENIKLHSETEGYQQLSGLVDWVAVKNKFFATVMIPERETRLAELEGLRFGDRDQDPANYRESYIARLAMGRPDAADAFKLYIGPMDYRRISGYDLGLYDMVEFGFGETITRPIVQYVIIPVFDLLDNFIGSYGLIIIIFALLIKIILFPLTKSSFQSMAKMRALQPRIKEMQEKHKDDPQKQQQAMMKIYRETGVNPLGSCLPMFLQFPVLIAMWRFFPTSIQLRQEAFLWANDLSAPDVILNLPFSIPFYGDYVAGFTLLMGISQILATQLQSTATAGSAGQMKVLMYILPVFIMVIFNSWGAGINLYYLMYNVLSVAQQRLINRNIDQEALLAKAAPAKKTPQRRKKRKR